MKVKIKNRFLKEVELIRRTAQDKNYVLAYLSAEP